MPRSSPRKSKEKKKKKRGNIIAKKKKKKKKKERHAQALENQKKKKEQKKEEATLLPRRRRRRRRRKKKKKSRRTHGHFCQSRKNASPLLFLSIQERKHFGGSKKKTPRSHYLFSFFPTQPNTPKKFSFPFSLQSFLSILFHL